MVEVEQWSLRVLTDDAQVPIEPRSGRGAVIDLGTTTLVVQVVDLSSGEVQRVETALNPQARYGADVMSRLQYDLQRPGELGRLSAKYWWRAIRRCTISSAASMWSR